MKTAPFCLIALVSVLCLLGTNLSAQIAVDSAYVGRGIRPFDQPIDPDLYLIRPGEKLEVVFLSARLATLYLTVNAEGRIVNRDLGVVDLAGKTLSQAREMLLEPLTNLFNASEIVISIASIYPVSIQVTGMVNQPGTYVGYTSQRVNEIIDSAGGVAPGGSTRNVSFDGGDLVTIVDMDRHRFGDNRFNPCLYAGTRVHVPAQSQFQVQILGEVIAPRAVEVRGDETLTDLIDLAGGLLPSADLDAAHLLNDSTRDPGEIRAGDVLVIPPSADAMDTRGVHLFGAVKRPGRYDLSEGVSLAGMIAVAGGFGPRANRDRVTVFRRAETDALGRRVPGRYPLNPREGSRLESVPLKPGDSVFVPVLVGYVSVSGLVARPGMVLYQAGQTVAYYLGLAGGVAEDGDDIIVEILDRVSGITRMATARTNVYDGDRIIVKAGGDGQ